MTAREWLRERANAVAAAVRSLDDYFTVLDSLGIQVKPRISAKTGEVDGYSLAAPGDAIWFGGSKLAPDLSYNRLREHLPTQDVPDRPQPAADPAEPWRRTESAVHTAHAVLDAGDDAVAQGYLLGNFAGDGRYGTKSADLRVTAFRPVRKRFVVHPCRSST